MFTMFEEDTKQRSTAFWQSLGRLFTVLLATFVLFGSLYLVLLLGE
jgi:hypothetical protein